MIVLDENISRRAAVGDNVARWYAGKVISIRDLRPKSRILDEAIPQLLASQNQPTFVTTNVSDFWGHVRPHHRLCVVCIGLPNDRQPEISPLLRSLFRHREFRTKAARMGKIVLVSYAMVRWYSVGRKGIRKWDWSRR